MTDLGTRARTRGDGRSTGDEPSGGAGRPRHRGPAGRAERTAAGGRVRVPRQRSAPAPVDAPSAPSAPAAGGARADRARPLPPRRTAFTTAIPIVLGSLTLVGAVGTGATLLTRGTGESSHQLSTPDRAGGLVRDTSQDAALADRVASVRDSFDLQFMGRLDQFVSAVYRPAPGSTPTAHGPVVFVGATMDTRGDPGDFVSAVRQAAADEGLRAVSVPTADGARAVCLVPATTSTTGSAAAGTSTAVSCAWSTGDSVGQVVPTTTTWTLADLRRLMTGLRPDVEAAS